MDGLAEARRRIAVCRETQNEELDLGGLGLNLPPDAELWQEIYECGHVKRLYLGLGKEDRRLPYWAISEDDKKACSTLHTLSETFCNSLSRLKKLDLGYCDLDQLPANFDKLIGITELDLSDTKVCSLGTLSNLKKLEKLKLQYTKVQDLNPISKLTQLKELDLEATQVNDLGVLGGLSQLEKLDLEFTKVSDLNALSGLTHLTQLYLWGTGVIELSQLSGLKQLTHLFFGNTQVSNLDPLSNLTQLMHINLQETPVRDLSPLLGLRQLTSLDLRGCQFNKDFKNIWFLEALKDVRLHKASVPGIPAEILSKTYNENCLPRLRAYFTDLENGTESVRDTKLIILGNGRVGKTQICRRLQNKNYDDTIPSTHGIQIATTPLGDDKDKTRLQIWDFGGQDIYHGTHSLFLKSRAAFLIVWTPDMEEEREHEYDGYIFRNEPLPYWVNYIHQAAGKDAPMLILQTRVDDAEVEVEYQPIEKKRLEGFRFRPRVLQYSAMTDFNRAALDDALKLAADWLREQRGSTTVIGKGWAKVKHKLEAMRDKDLQKEPDQRKNRTIAYQKFCDICKKTGGVSNPDVLLGYLHDTGIIFYQKDMFGNKIILDQQWALEAIYAVLDRDATYNIIKQRNGRFTRSDLGHFLWNKKYSEEEQELFLQMMISCGVCFIHQPGDEKNNVEAAYIAPDLLPEKPDPLAISAWCENDISDGTTFRYDLLMPGLMQRIISDIGSKAGIAAEYWRDGVYVYETQTGSLGMITQERGEKWSGCIKIRTQKGQASDLFKMLVGIVKRHEEKFYVKSIQDTEVFLKTAELRLTTYAPKVKIGFQASEKNEYYVSYAWKDEDDPEREVVVDRLSEIAEAEKDKIRIIRDKDYQVEGERITKFMHKIGKGDRVIIILSHKYLISAYCMYELWEIWRDCKLEADQFLKKTKIYVLPCAEIGAPEDRKKWAEHWKGRYENLQNNPSSVGDMDNRWIRNMGMFAIQIPCILEAIADTVTPQTVEGFVSYVFNDDENNKDEASA